MTELPALYSVGDPDQIDFSPALSLARSTMSQYGELVEFVTLWPEGACDLHLVGGAVVQVAKPAQTYTYPEPHVPRWLRARLAIRRALSRI